MTASDQQRLGKTSWAIADPLRGVMNTDDHFPDATKMVLSRASCVRSPDHFRNVAKLIRPVEPSSLTRRPC